MAHRIEVFSKIPDTRAEIRKQRLLSEGFPVSGLELVDVYTTEDDINAVGLAEMLTNPVTQDSTIHQPYRPDFFSYAVEIGFLPGVTDNVGNTARQIAEDMAKKKFPGQGVYSSQLMFLSGDLSKEDAVTIANSFSNPVIQRVSVKSFEEFMESDGMHAVVPRVKLHESPGVDVVDLLGVDNEELVRIGKQGIRNPDGTTRGPLAMDLTYMKACHQYSKKIGRNLTDIELESLAQTWSEHCHHTIFADPIDEFQEGLFSTFIKGATREIRRKKGGDDFCVSVFSDNAGGIVFDEEFLVCDKVETHNSPSALDPFGGAITGIVGVNRDPMGFGRGAKPIINRFGFCFGNPLDERVLYKDKERKQKMLSPRRIMDGVIEGVNVGGNCSGIPTPQGFVYFDDSYRGKPLVFVGTVGLIPREVNGRKMYEKQASPGDLIVMVGGRVGKDGIHGATFSSEAIDSGSPATAVQIGDPITQKKMSDALIKEARDMGLYSSITDNGAGGLSCSVAEMGKESGGFEVDLDKVPLKYPGLAPWEAWVSESQERMTLASPPDKAYELVNFLARRGVEATIIGRFSDSGKAVVRSNGKVILDLDMDFLHNGLPPRPMKTNYTRQKHEEPDFSQPENLTDFLCAMLARPNIASYEFISNQYDHEVQGGSVLKPLQGRGRVNANATAMRPRLDSDKALVLSQGINPSYSEIDTYHMAACAIDTAVRNAVAAGADLEHLALLDNFCWCSSTEPERLGQLVEACKACHDVALTYGTPFISGKDSMFNDFKGFDEQGTAVKISILPTLLVSALGVVKDARKLISIDAKCEGDLVYVLGKTDEELGGSEYFAMMGEQKRGKKFIGNNVPHVDAGKNIMTYHALQQAIERGIVASAIGVDRGGLGVALAKTAIAGQLGMDIYLPDVPTKYDDIQREDYLLFSESQGRLVVTIGLEYRQEFESLMDAQNIAYDQVGKVRKDNRFVVRKPNKKPIETTVDKLTESYRSTFKDY